MTRFLVVKRGRRQIRSPPKMRWMGEHLDTKTIGGAPGMQENHIVMWWKRKGINNIQ